MNILEIASRKIWNLHFVYLFHTYSGSDNCSGEAVGAEDNFVFCKPTDTEVSASVLAEVEYPSIMSFFVVFSLVCLWLWIIAKRVDQNLVNFTCWISHCSSSNVHNFEHLLLTMICGETTLVFIYHFYIYLLDQNNVK